MTEDGPVTADHSPQGSGAPSLHKELYSRRRSLDSELLPKCGQSHVAAAQKAQASPDMCAGCSAADGFYFLVLGEGRRHLRATPLISLEQELQ